MFIGIALLLLVRCDGLLLPRNPQLNLLHFVTPEGLSSLAEDDWEEVIMTVDSGAGETVIGQDVILPAEAREGPERGNISFDFHE